MQTMALEITEKTYPIAVACLPDMFLTIPVNQVYGCFLVINEIGVLKTEETGMPIKHIAISNTWYDKETFLMRYQPKDQLPFNPFFLVTHN